MPEKLRPAGGCGLLKASTLKVNILGGSIHTIKKNIGASLVCRGEIGLEVNAAKSKYMIVSCDQNAG